MLRSLVSRFFSVLELVDPIDLDFIHFSEWFENVQMKTTVDDWTDHPTEIEVPSVSKARLFRNYLEYTF